MLALCTRAPANAIEFAHPVTEHRPVVLDALDSRGRGLRATFVWFRDRWAHTIAVVTRERMGRERVGPLLASDEGCDHDDWPPSPPLAQLHVEDRAGGGRVALLVGMAGRSHWSLSVEALAEARQLVFDAACRLGGSADSRSGRLGSRYRAMIAPAPDAKGIARISAYGSTCYVACEPAGECPTGVLSVTSIGLTIVPSTDGGANRSAPNRRWRYRVTLTEG